ncbi:wax ester/triacylglycerol synthase domain-containing protein [Streptomyces broussonetiae]|uniref:Wax ester/triacylglycerol synthase domain-containing protein n=1 Tax=Streptomyces broussonetiae TaxID=2686304 RepID=A0ABV5EMM7_9ACTN
MTRAHPGTGGGLPPSLPMATADVAYHVATRGRPLPVVFVFWFPGRPPTLDAVRARVAERAHRIPSLRYGIVRDRKVFRRADRLPVEQYVHEAGLPGDDDGSAAARMMLTHPMAGGGRPPWDVWLLHGPGDDGYALCYRTDHALQDGVGACHAVRALLDDHPVGGPAPARLARPTARGVLGALGDVVTSLRTGHHPMPALDAAGGGGSPGVSHTRTPLARLRSIGRAHGGTVNDVYLAALAHAVHAWHLKDTGAVHPPLPVVIPISVRAAGEECAPGNRMVVARLLLPSDEPSPQRALARVMAATGRLRGSRQRDAMRLLLSASPRAVGARIGTRMVNGAVVAGPASSVNFGQALVHQGATSRAATVFSTLASAVPWVVTLTSQHDTACLTVVHDAALTTAHELTDLWQAALLELERP